MKIFKRSLSFLLAGAMAVSLAACGNNASTSTAASGGGTSSGSVATNDKVLVIGVDANFEEKWNPFLAESAYDMQVMEQIFVPIQMLDAENKMVPHGGSMEVEAMDDGSALYTIKVNEGMTFTDGTPVTIDDYIYGLYVRSDSSYTGPNATIGSDIEGLLEYYYDDPDFSSKIAAIEKEFEMYKKENLTFELFLEWANTNNIDGWFDPENVQATVDELKNDFGGKYDEQLAKIDTTNVDAVRELYARAVFDFYLDYFDLFAYFVEPKKAELAAGNIADGIDVPEISGITKIDDYTCTVKYTKLNVYADRDLTGANGLGNLAPKHYYGEFEKGDVSKILANMVPLGSGPYIWGGFSDNIVTATANPNYFLGAPVTGTVRWQYIPQTDIIAALASGKIDIAEPSASQANVAEMKDLGLEFDLVDNDGYGYMGMNTENQPLNVRKGVWSLMNRQPAVEAYYGTELAEVIERPLSTVVAEYPQDAKPFYEYSREKALAFFEAAGYTQKDGKLVDATGKQLVVNAFIGGDGEGNHPAYPMLTQAAEDMKALGAELQINDVGFAVLQGAMNDGTADIFILAWSKVNTADKSTQFRSTGGQNRYRFKDAKMDSLLDSIGVTVDFDARKKLVSEMLDYAMENCLELPLYQRKNVMAYNQKSLNMDTIPEATTFYSYKAVLHEVEVIG